MNLAEKLKELGYNTVGESFYTYVGLWKNWYEGEVKNFHRYKVRNSGRMVNCKRYSLGMAKKVAEDWADLLANEKVSVAIDGEAEQEYVDAVLRANNHEIKINEMQELKCALGTVAYVPRVMPLGEIAIDYVTVEHIHPLSWTNGVITECAFDSIAKAGSKEYLYLQIHKRGADGLYAIENRIYEHVNGQLTEVPLASVAGYEGIPNVVYTGSDKRQFVIDRPNIANNIDYAVPLGISVYANALDVLAGTDIAYDSYVNEFVLGKKRIMVQIAATKTLAGEDVFDSNDLVYYVLPEDIADGSVIEPIDMSLRTTEHNTGIQDQLNMLSAKCGFGENRYRFDGGSVATATQVISENSAMFRALKKHEIVLREALIELCRIIIRLGNSAAGMRLDENVDITVNFDDSIIEDTGEKLRGMKADADSGYIRPELYVMEKYGVSEEEARKMMPGMEDMLDGEGQGEIE